MGMAVDFMKRKGRWEISRGKSSYGAKLGKRATSAIFFHHWCRAHILRAVGA